MTDMQAALIDDKSNARVVFDLVRGPTTKGWPTRGQHAIILPEGSIASDDEFFSVEALRGSLKDLIDRGLLSTDQASDIEREARELGLPHNRTRFDRLIAAPGLDAADKHRLISVFSGATSAEEGSGSARFEQCQGGSLCQLPNCGHYPTHGALYPEGIVTSYGHLVFSTGSAIQRLQLGIDQGVFLPENEELLMQQIGRAGLGSSAELTRAEMLMRCNLDRGQLAAYLGVVCGLNTPHDPTRFEACGNHAHLYAFDRVEVGHRVSTRYDAERLMRVAIDSGRISTDAQLALSAQLDALELPSGSAETSSFGEQSRVARIVISYFSAEEPLG